MKNALICALTLSVSTFALSSSAFADARDDRIAALEAQMQLMYEELQRLKADQSAEKKFNANENAAMRAEIKMLEAQNTAHLNTLEPAAGTSGDITEFRKGDFSLKIRGQAQVDVGVFDDDVTDHPDSAEFRRLRLTAQGDLPGEFGYKIQVGFEEDQLDVEDAFITYNGFDNTVYTLGHHKTFYGIEETGSSNDTTFMERASANSAFFQGRAIGLSVLTHREDWFFGAGVFNDDAGTASNDDEAFSASARFGGTPYRDGDNLFHLSGFVDYQIPDRANDSFSYDANAENSFQTTDSVSVTVSNADDAIVYGIGGAMNWGSVLLQGEYFATKVNTTAGSDPSFDGAYGQISWILTSESRPYDASEGTIGRPKPNNPFNPKSGGWGAFELAARYSTLDLNDGGFTGGQLDTYTIGANWYLNNYLRVSGNYVMADTDSNAPVPNDDPNLFLMRAQTTF